MIGRVSLRDGLLLFVAVLCVSASAPLIAACAAPALAIAMYRCLLATGLTAAWMAATSRRLRLPGRPCRRWSRACAGRPFRDLDPQPAVHQCRVEHGHDLHTAGVVGPASEVLRGQAGPAGVDRDRGQRGRGAAAHRIGELDADAWIGMGLALIAAVLAAIYVAFGERLRATTDLGSYTTSVYAVAAVSLLVLCLGLAVPCWDMPRVTGC